MLVFLVACSAVCTRPPTAETRQTGWVDIQPTRVLKHVQPLSKYLHEKAITTTLGRWPQFVSLMAYNDTCRVLTIRKIHQTSKKICMGENEHRQIREIFFVLEKLRLEPSTEIYYGFMNNIMIDDDGYITMYDFGNYRVHRPPWVIRSIRDKLIKVLDRKYGRCADGLR